MIQVILHRFDRLTRRMNAVVAALLFVVLCAPLCSGAVSEQLELDVSRTRLSPMELAIWNDAAFKKQFAESYIAETEIEPRVTVEERDQMLKVMEQISEDKIDEAAKLLKKEIDRNEAASAVFDFTLANIYFQQADAEGLSDQERAGKLEQAIEYYHQAVEKYPKFRRAWRNLALIFVRDNKFEKALPALTTVIELGGGDAITYGLLGFAYSSVENNLSAESAYRMAILLDPKTLDWKMGLARSFFKQERFSEAVALCKLLISEYPDRADLWMLQANAYIGQSKPLEAAEIFEFVDHLGKSTVESLNMLGDIYINEQLYEMAAEAYIDAMQKDPKYDPQRAVRSAKVLVARGAFAETRRIIEQIGAKYGDGLDTELRKEVLKLQARLAVADGSGDEEEVRVLKEIVALDPLDGEALILLGQHAGRTGDIEQAIFYFERAAGLEKYEADANVRHAQLLVQQGKYSEALPLLRRAQQITFRENIQEYLEQVERVAKAR